MAFRFLLPAAAGARPPGFAADGPERPVDLHRRLPGYAPTPLRSLPGIAARLGVAEVLAKDESERLGLPSYKILGASWAVYRTLIDEAGVRPGEWRTADDLRAALDGHRPLTLVAATDGNHGRAVARMARLLGLDAHILVPEGTAAARIEGIASEGARVTVVDGTYDEAVERSAAEAGPRSLVISDTAWPGYDTVPRRVIEGYGTVFAEVDAALDAPVTHVMVPVGVGSLAAAAATWAGPGGARLVGVEPLDAACVLASVAAGVEVEVPGPHRSMMAGLNCGRPSPLAFPLVSTAYAGFVAVDDALDEEAMRWLAAEGMAVGESGAAALAGLLALAGDDGLRAAVGLDTAARVLLLVTEGVTDPANYARVVPPPRPPHPPPPLIIGTSTPSGPAKPRSADDRRGGGDGGEAG